MHQFSVLPTFAKDLQRKLLPILLLLPIMMLFVVVGLPLLRSEEVTFDSSTVLTLLMFMAILVFTFINSLKRQKAMFGSYKLTIMEERISREMINMPVLVIHRKDIRDIVKNADGTISIIGDSKLNIIGIPAHIERKEELEVILNNIKTITVKTVTPWYQRYILFLAMAIVGLIFSVFSLENKFLSSVGGLCFVALMIYSFVVIQKSKNVDTRTKRWSYIVIIPVLSILGGIIAWWMS